MSALRARWHRAAGRWWTATAYYAHSATRLAAIADTLGDRALAARYRALVAEVRSAFAAGDIRTTIPRFSEENRAANQALVDLVGEVAATHQATAAQVALAWLLAQRPTLVPIPGTRRLSRLQENLGALQLQLGDEDLTRLGEAADRLGVAGARYNEAMQKMTGL